MYYILKLLSYSPIINVVGENKEFGDISRESEVTRISLLGFTVIYFWCILSLSIDKNKKCHFDIIKKITYPISLADKKKDLVKISEFSKEINILNDNSIKLKIDVIKYLLDGQKEVINSSILKAGMILPIFLALFIYIFQSKIVNIDFYALLVQGGLFFFIIMILMFCYFATSTNLLFFIAKLAQVSDFLEVSIPKSSKQYSLLIKEEAIEYYQKYRGNKIKSNNIVSYNIWVQDYFKKFFIYALILFTFISFIPDSTNKAKTPNSSKYEIQATLVYNVASLENGHKKLTVFLLKNCKDSITSISVPYILDALNRGK
jgi:hypothetical protein